MPLALDKLPSPAELTGVNADNFKQRVMDPYQPAVLRGFARHWPLVQAARQSDQAAARLLQQHTADQPQALLSLPASAQGRLFYNDSLSGMNYRAQRLGMREAINQMLSQRADGERYCVQCVPVQLLNREFQRWSSAHGMRRLEQWDRSGMYFVIHALSLKSRSHQECLKQSVPSY